MPCLARRREVTRVSSAAIAETSPRTRRARALTSSRLPIGVATTKSRLIQPLLPLRGHLPMNGEDPSVPPPTSPLMARRLVSLTLPLTRHHPAPRLRCPSRRPPAHPPA